MPGPLPLSPRGGSARRRTRNATTPTDRLPAVAPASYLPLAMTGVLIDCNRGEARSETPKETLVTSRGDRGTF